MAFTGGVYLRYPEFKMERENLVHVGERVEFTESQLPMSYYYTIVPSVAMSRNYEPFERIKSREGIVKEIRETSRGFYVVLELDEDSSEVPDETEEAYLQRPEREKTDGGSGSEQQ